MSFTAGLKSKSLVWHPTPTLTISQHSHQHPLPPSLLYCFSACTKDPWRWCKQTLQETKDKESQRPGWCRSSLHQSLCCPAIIHFHIDLQQMAGVVWSPLLLQTLHHHPCTQKPKITGLNDYRPVALTSVLMKWFERLVLAHLKDITGILLDPCSFPTEQTGLWMMQSTWDYTTSSNIWTNQGLMQGFCL